jgi:hypothetical protein
LSTESLLLPGKAWLASGRPAALQRRVQRKRWVQRIGLLERFFGDA